MHKYIHRIFRRMHLCLFNNQPHRGGGNQVEESRGLAQSQRQDSTGPWPHTVSVPRLTLLGTARPGNPHHVSRGPAHWCGCFLVFPSCSCLGWREWAIQATWETLDCWDFQERFLFSTGTESEASLPSGYRSCCSYYWAEAGMGEWVDAFLSWFCSLCYLTREMLI